MTASTPAESALPAVPLSAPQRVTALRSRKVSQFDLKPDAALRQRIAAYLNISALRTLRFRGQIRPEGRHDFVLEAELTATVEQPCSLTLDPVVTKITDTVLRRYVRDMPEPTADEVEMPEDDTAEPLGDVIDPGHVAVEALALALPLYPRAPGAALAQTTFTEPGVAPLQDADLRPFAGLAALKAALAPTATTETEKPGLPPDHKGDKTPGQDAD